MANAEIASVPKPPLTALGSAVGDTHYDRAADRNRDGFINVLDIASARVPNRSAAQPVAAANEAVVILPLATVGTPGNTVSIQFLIQNNTTPILGYSLDVKLTPVVGAVAPITADPATTNFFDSQNIITAGGAVRDPLFSIIQSNDANGVFINTITEDNSTVLAVDGVNDVLAEVFIDLPIGSCGDYTIDLGPATAISDGNAFAIPFSFVPGTVTVEECPIPAVSTWGVINLTILVLTAGTLILGNHHRLGVES